MQDLASTNGTLVNGRRIEDLKELRHGDVVCFGQRQFRVSLFVPQEETLSTYANDTTIFSGDYADERPLSSTKYAVTAPELTEVTVRHVCNNWMLTSKLLTLSQNSLDVTLPGAKYGERLNIRLHCSHAQICTILDGYVASLRRIDDEQCRVGCRLEVGVSERLIEDLRRIGAIERRHDRIPVDMHAIARWELHPEPHPVTLVDYSPDGFGMQSPVASSLGTRVCVEVATEKMYGKVRWRKPSEFGHRIGCEFFGDSLCGRGAQIVATATGT